MTRYAPRREMIEIRRAARTHKLLLIEKPIDDGKSIYSVYRILPDGRKSFLGKRGTVIGICAYISRLIQTVPEDLCRKTSCSTQA